MIDEKRVEAIAKTYCDSSDGDAWEVQTASYRKQIRRIVRYILALNEKMDEIARKKGSDNENSK
jgi:hypothetical protein